MVKNKTLRYFRSHFQTTFPISPSFNPNKELSPCRARQTNERRRKISRVENDVFPGGMLFVAEDANRKFSVGSRLLASPRGCSRHHHYQPSERDYSNNYLGVDDAYNRPASRSHSVDNSLAEKVDLYRDSNSTGSAYSGRSYSSLSSVEKENVWKLSISSDSRCRYERFLSPSPIRASKDCGTLGVADICRRSLDFVQEVGYYLDPSRHPEDSSEPRVPCFKIVNVERRRRSPQPLSLSREKIKKQSVFSLPNYSLERQICRTKEPATLRSEHGFSLIVPESHRQGPTEGSNKESNCKIS